MIDIRNTKPMFALDFWNDGPYVEVCIAAGRRYFYINAKGDVEPCVYTHIATDNIRDTTLARALHSDLFRDIRSRQPHNSNHLRPCMIIDNPHVMRDVIAKNHPYFTPPQVRRRSAPVRPGLWIITRTPTPVWRTWSGERNT